MIKLDSIAKEAIPETALEKIQRQERYRVNLRRHYEQQALRERIKNRAMIPFAGQMFQIEYDWGEQR